MPSPSSVTSTRISLPSEIAAVRPSVALIMVGHNDMTLAFNPEQYRAALGAMVDTAVGLGVIPVLSTNHFVNVLPTHTGGLISAYNQVVVEVARERNVPLLNWWRANPETPNPRTDFEGVHLNTSPFGSGDFSAFGREFGNNRRNLVTLQALEKIQRIVIHDQDPDLGLPDGGEAWTPLDPGAAYTAAASPADEPHVVRVLNADTGAVVNSFSPFGRSFAGGADVALADVNLDGVQDVIVGAGIGAGPAVQVFDGGDGLLVHNFFAYGAAFRGGVNVAVGDVNGDSVPDIVTGTGFGGGPHVRAFSGDDLSILADEFAFDLGFKGGVRVAAGDLDGDGTDEIIAGAGLGGGPRVRVMSADGEVTADFFAYSPSVRAGVFVDTADTDGDGIDELITGAGQGGAHVLIFAGVDPQVRHSFFAAKTTSGRGVRVATVQRPDEGEDVLAHVPGRIPLASRFAGESLELTHVIRIGDPFAEGAFIV